MEPASMDAPSDDIEEMSTSAIIAAAKVDAELVMDTYAFESAVEKEMAGGSWSQESAMEAVLDNWEGAASMTSGESQLLTTILSSDPAGTNAEVEVEDVTLGNFSTKIVEDKRCITAEEKEVIQSWKLKRSELKELVPEDWDTINIDWFSNKEEGVPLPAFKLNFLWSEKNIAVSVDQVYARGQISPLTEFFFWPRKDAWEELKGALEQRIWINQRDKVQLLNRLTEVINFWQQGTARPTVDDARAEFPDCAFTFFLGKQTVVPPP